MYQHFACKVIRPSSLIALLAMRYRGKDTSLPWVKDTLLSKSEGKYGVMMTCHNTTTVLRKESTKVELLETLHYNNGNCQS